MALSDSPSLGGIQCFGSFLHMTQGFGIFQLVNLSEFRPPARAKQLLLSALRGCRLETGLHQITQLQNLNCLKRICVLFCWTIFLEQSDGRGSRHLLRGQIDFLEAWVVEFPVSH